MIGETVSRYRIVQELGSGGMGIVYEAEDTVLGRKVALKFLPASLMDDQSAAERFTAEARTASALNHPNIVTIYEIGSASIGHFIAMEYVDGQTLRSMVGTQQPLEWFVPLAQQIARALVVAHGAGIVHRDIKPDNVMVRPDGIIKLLDFGLARLIPTNQSASQTETTRSRPGTRTGTFRYMSPEQAGAEYLASATDIFSLGVVFYELVGGIHPFTADPDTPVLTAILSLSPPPLAHYNPDVPADLEDLILRMLEKQPRMRIRLLELGAQSSLFLSAAYDVLCGLPQSVRSMIGRKNHASSRARRTTDCNQWIRCPRSRADVFPGQRARRESAGGSSDLTGNNGHRAARRHESRPRTREDGRREEARELVIPTYQWFSEGWETADLREARALTEPLRQ